jgi:hypothetical protein
VRAVGKNQNPSIDNRVAQPPSRRSGALARREVGRTDAPYPAEFMVPTRDFRIVETPHKLRPWICPFLYPFLLPLAAYSFQIHERY